ncbi:MAG: hypothetical protein ACKO8I_01245 [Cyanobacteriota bacterium]
MALDLCGAPLIDRADFEELAGSGIFGPWLDQARSMREQGFCLLSLNDGAFQQRCQHLKTRLADVLAGEIAAWHRGEAGPPRLHPGGAGVDPTGAVGLRVFGP